METYLAACVQLEGGTDPTSAWDRTLLAVEEAGRRGAALVALPENFLYVGPDEDAGEEQASFEGRFAETARRLGIWFLAGSIREPASGHEGKHYNTSLLFDPDGNRVAAYRKIHLFDVDVPGETAWCESSHVVPGTEVVVADTALGRLGLSICYDLRFPELYRTMALAGAELFFVPSNFRLMTGKDHWRPLLQARAIENAAYVLAPALTGGQHDGTRWAFGQSAIVDPWGTVVARAGDGAAVVVAPIERARVRDVRRRLPCLEHAVLLRRRE